MTTTGNRWQQLFAELKRRRVFRVATLYLVACWPVIQIVDIMSPALELPDSVMRYLIIAFVTGFPIALVLAWIFDINKEGVVVTDDSLATDAPLIGSRAEIMVVGTLIALVAVLFVAQLMIGEPEEVEVLQAPDRYSVGVLPFVSFSDEISDQQFADGLTEELLNVLARVKALRVAARTSSFAYRGVNKNVTEIGRELNVGIILEGSVRRNDIDNTIRITAQLIETETGSHLWSNTYDRKFTDVFKIQDDISAAVVDELQITLLGDEREKIQSRTSANPEAMVAYGMGQAELARRTVQGFNDAHRFFDRAIELDPEYVDAIVGKATTDALTVSYQGNDKRQHLERAQKNIDRALALDPESGSAWATQGLIYMQEDRSAEARTALEKALAFNPSHALAAMWYAGEQENQDERLKWYLKAYELDPRSPIIGYNVANIYFAQGREADAMQVYVQMIESDPYYHGAYHLAGRMNESKGRLDAAISEYLQAYELSPGGGYAGSLVQLYRDIGDFDQAQYWLGVMANAQSPALRAYYDWLLISSYAAADKVEMAIPLLQAKAELYPDAKDDEKLAEAALAAYLLEDYDTAIAAYEAMTTEATPKHFNNSNRIDALVGVAYAYKQVGRLEDSRQLTDQLEILVDQFAEEGEMVHHSVWFIRSEIAMLRDEKQMALVHFQRAIDEGWRAEWLTKVLPLARDLAREPAFQTMVAALEARIELMREQLTLASTFDDGWGKG